MGRGSGGGGRGIKAGGGGGGKAAKAGGGGADSGPQQMNIEQFFRSQGYTGSAMGEAISMSSPSGKVSGRAAAAGQARLRAQQAKEAGLRAEFQRLVNTGKVIDPTGRHRPAAPRPSVDAQHAASLLRQAAELRGLADRGMKPRAHRKRADQLEAMAKALS